MRNFTPEDFEGGGQYLLRLGNEEIFVRENGKPFRGYSDAGYLSTITYKVGYMHNNFGIGNGNHITTLTSMSDGWTRFCHYPNSKKAQEYNLENKQIDFDEWEKTLWQDDKDENGDVTISGRQKFCDYLNNPETQEMRFATQEEIVRVVMYQKSRWR